MKIISNTLVKNGTPFIGKVLKQVLPYVDKCVITLSPKSVDGTIDIISDLKNEHPYKIDINLEHVTRAGQLTKERDRMIARSKEADWIMFLDDDDYWPTDSLESMIRILGDADAKTPAFSVDPYDVISRTQHDYNWRNKSFSKWFRNKDINFRGDWPRDLVYTGNEPLYWRDNKKVIRLPGKRFYHLAHVKNMSWRQVEDWGKDYEHYKFKGVKPVDLPKDAKAVVKEIFDA